MNIRNVEINELDVILAKWRVRLARLILTSYSKIKDALFFKMFIYMYKKDFPQKNIFFFALTGRPEAIYFAL